MLTLPSLKLSLIVSSQVAQVAALILLLVPGIAYRGSAQTKHPLKIWFDQPASTWEATLPTGNGRLGMTPDGGISKERIVLNDITLWSGSKQDANNYNAYKLLPEINRLLEKGKNDEAEKLMDGHFVCTGPGSGGAQWGCFQILANLDIGFKHAGPDTNYKNYSRRLSLDSALVTTQYSLNNVQYKREYYSSFGDDVNIISVTASKKRQISFSIRINRPERGATEIVSGKSQVLAFSGQLDNGTDGKGMRFHTQVSIKNVGGKVIRNGDFLEVSGADAAVIIISSATDFNNPDYRLTVTNNLAKARASEYAKQKSRHLTGYKKLFDRLSLDLGQGKADAWPTNERLASYYQHPENDLGLPALFFQYARYLAISSTRVGLLPPNLQGLWANQVRTPWNGDYHLDVNVQMNHWPFELANLSELNLPLTELVRNLVEPGKKTAKAYYNANGWVAHVITNVWGFTEPGESTSWGITKSGSGWLCNNLWEHYAFTGDEAYLKRIYPIIKGSAQFYSSILVRDEKTNWLVTSPSSSPENSFILPNGNHAHICRGATIDNQIIRDLFNNVIVATEKLGTDRLFADTLRTLLEQLPPPGIISADGRIQEWLEDYQEADRQHRHVSHLWGLFPANLITPEGTPALAAAAKKTLEVRGDDGPSWSIAYKQIFWARLLDGNRAFKLLRELLKPTLNTEINYGAGGGVYPNLLSAGPPFQIDGNFGSAAGIGEMLIQSHAGYIELLPAIPDLWRSFGNMRGFKARGNFTIDATWKDGKVTHYRIASKIPQQVRVKVNGTIKEITSEPL